MTAATVAAIMGWSPMRGAPIWEFIERGGSYGAPLALAIVIAAQPSRQSVGIGATEPTPVG